MKNFFQQGRQQIFFELFESHKGSFNSALLLVVSRDYLELLFHRVFYITVQLEAMYPLLFKTRITNLSSEEPEVDCVLA